MLQLKRYHRYTLYHTHTNTQKCTLEHAALMSHRIKQFNIRELQRLLFQTVLQIKTDTTATFWARNFPSFASSFRNEIRYKSMALRTDLTSLLIVLTQRGSWRALKESWPTIMKDWTKMFFKVVLYKLLFSKHCQCRNYYCEDENSDKTDRHGWTTSVQYSCSVFLHLFFTCEIAAEILAFLMKHPIWM